MIKVASVFAQVFSLIDRREFSRSVAELQAEKAAKGFRCWEQLVSMLFCHMAKRSTLSYANSYRSWQLFEKVFYHLLSEPIDHRELVKTIGKYLPSKELALINRNS